MKNVKKIYKKREQWEKIAKKRVSKDKKEMKKLRTEQDARLETNQISLANPEQRQMYEERLFKKMGHQKTHIQEARERRGKLFKFVPSWTKSDWELVTGL